MLNSHTSLEATNDHVPINNTEPTPSPCTQPQTAPVLALPQSDALQEPR